MYRTEFWTLWEKARVGCFERTASKHVYYIGWNRSPAQVGCMRQVLRPGALGRPRGIRWRGRWEGGSGWGMHVNPRLIHVNVWQNPLQYCKVISLQLIKINEKEKKKRKWLLSLRGTNEASHTFPPLLMHRGLLNSRLDFQPEFKAGEMSHRLEKHTQNCPSLLMTRLSTQKIPTKLQNNSLN